MAIKYESLLAEIIPMVPGCPDTLIESNIRAAAIELCEKAPVYQQELDPVTTVANIYEYDLEPPSGAVVHKVMWLTFEGNDLEPISTGLLEQRVPKWRNADQAGKPDYFVKVNQSTFWLVPVPNETKSQSVILRAQLKPTYSSTACDDDVMTDYREAIIQGTLFRLLRIPSKEWTDFGAAQVYGTLFQQSIQEADRRARHEDMPIARKVTYGGVHRSYKLQRNKYGREVK